MTNLEWLCEHAPSKLAKVISEGAVDCDWCAEDRLDNCSCECAKGHLEWLIAPHEDANDDFTPETDVTAVSVDANDGTVTTMPLHVPSETIVNGERVRGIPKIGWSEQTAEKMEGLVDSKPICGTQDEEPTNYTTQGENDAQAAREHAQTADADSREKCGGWNSETAACSRGLMEPDSREKLEADVLDAGCADEIDYDRIIGWLDRQAEITRKTEQAAWIQQANGLIHEAQVERDEAQAELRKFKDFNNDVNAECAELQEKVDNLKAERDALQRRCENQRHELGQLNRAMRDMKLAEDLDDVLYNGGGARDWYMACQEQAKLVEMLERRNVDLSDALADAMVDELTNKNMQLAHELGVTLADRDEYRALVGQMLDAAQEIRRIADANMPSGARVVVDYEGEVVA